MNPYRHPRISAFLFSWTQWNPKSREGNICARVRNCCHIAVTHASPTQTFFSEYYIMLYESIKRSSQGDDEYLWQDESRIVFIADNSDSAYRWPPWWELSKPVYTWCKLIPGSDYLIIARCPGMKVEEQKTKLSNGCNNWLFCPDSPKDLYGTVFLPSLSKFDSFDILCEVVPQEQRALMHP